MTSNGLDTPQALAIGASTGGLEALKTILTPLPANFPYPIFIVQHRKSTAVEVLPQLLRNVCKLPVMEANDKAKIYPGHVYVAPANYHLLVEMDKSLSLSIDERVSFARPSIDVLFGTAAEAYRKCMVALLLTGANHDGTAGMHKVKALGGTTIAQDPFTAEANLMPQSAIDAGVVDHVVPLEEIASFILEYFLKC